MTRGSFPEMDYDHVPAIPEIRSADDIYLQQEAFLIRFIGRSYYEHLEARAPDNNPYRSKAGGE